MNQNSSKNDLNNEQPVSARLRPRNQQTSHTAGDNNDVSNEAPGSARLRQTNNNALPALLSFVNIKKMQMANTISF